MKVVQISDTHIPAAGGLVTRNLERIADFVNEVLRPDLIIHTGDIVALSPDSPTDRDFAHAAHGSFAAPVRFLPGNHDIGEPGDRPWMGLSVTSERVAAHRARFGIDRFSERLGAWTVIGINSQLFGSGLVEEGEQWDWLQATLAGIPTDGYAVLFLHMALWQPRQLPSEEVALCIPASDADRLLALPGAERIRAVASGHLHRYRRRVRPRLLEVWSPSTAFIGQTKTEISYFEQLGIVEWRLEADDLEVNFRAPVNLEECEATDIPELVESLEWLRWLVDRSRL